MKMAQKVVEAPHTPASITLDKADYFELRALMRDAELEAIKAEMAVRKAREAIRVKFQALSTLHGFDLNGNYTLDDATTSLTEIVP